MKLFSVLFLAASFALVACGDDSSSSAPADDNGSSSKTKYDCSVSGGVKVVYPTGGETFHMGDTITVVYGSDVMGSGYRFVYKVDEDDNGKDVFKGSVGPEEPDGKTCYEQEVVLDAELATSEEGFIQVIPYVETRKNGKSGKFTVTE